MQLDAKCAEVDAIAVSDTRKSICHVILPVCLFRHYTVLLTT